MIHLYSAHFPSRGGRTGYSKGISLASFFIVLNTWRRTIRELSPSYLATDRIPDRHRVLTGFILETHFHENISFSDLSKRHILSNYDPALSFSWSHELLVTGTNRDMFETFKLIRGGCVDTNISAPQEILSELKLFGEAFLAIGYRLVKELLFSHM